MGNKFFHNFVIFSCTRSIGFLWGSRVCHRGNAATFHHRVGPDRSDVFSLHKVCDTYFTIDLICFNVFFTRIKLRSVSEVRSYDETIRCAAKPGTTYTTDTSRASCYSCKPPSYCAYSEVRESPMVKVGKIRNAKTI